MPETPLFRKQVSSELAYLGDNLPSIYAYRTVFIMMMQYVYMLRLVVPARVVKPEGDRRHILWEFESCLGDEAGRMEMYRQRLRKIKGEKPRNISSSINIST